MSLRASNEPLQPGPFRSPGISRTLSRPSLGGAKLAVITGLLLGAACLVKGQVSQFTFDGNGNLSTQTTETGALPQILSQPQQQVTMPGNMASFFVVVADATGISYQWCFNGTNLSGDTQDTLLITNVSAANQGNYTVVLVNGSGSVTSAPAALMIDSRGVGMPDSWQLAYFGNLNQSPDGDYDGDGIPNLQEFLDGTNPTNSASARYQLSVFANGGTVTASPPGYSYTNGQVVTLTANASPPNTFRAWTGDASSQSNPLTLVITTNMSVRAVFAPATLPNGVISWWRAEDDASDALGQNNGTLVNGVTFAPGKVGNAFSLNANNQQYVSVPDSQSLRPSSFTLECWAMFNATNSGRDIIGKSLGAATADSFALFLTDDVLNGFVSDATGTGGPLVSAPFSPALGQWYHLAYTFDATTLLQQLYVNGAVIASGFGDRTPGYDAHPVLLGADINYGTVDGFFAGEIDEAAIYSRALSASEIAAIYQADLAGKATNAPVFISTSPLADAAVNLGYTQQVATVFGIAPLRFSVTAGALPAGMALSTSGIISGVPTSSGTGTFELTVTDAAGMTDSQTYSLNVEQPAPLPNGLISWWRGEGDATDAVGQNNGSLINGAGFAPGKVGTAFSLNGANQYVTVPDSPTLRPSSFTLECWAMFAATNGFRLIISKPLGAGIADSFAIWFTDDVLNGVVCDTATTGGPTISTPFSPVLGQWYHLAYTFDGTTLQQQLYVNGSVVASGLGDRGPGYDSRPVQLGADIDNGADDGFFAGEIDEAQIYSRALSTNEIAAIYQADLAGQATNRPVFISPAPLTSAVINVGYTQQVVAAFGTAPLQLSVTAGALPAGLVISTNGLISGVPTNAGISTFGLTVTDALGMTNSQTYSLNVLQPVAPPGLISWWRAEGNTADSVGPNTATWTGTASYVPGVVGQAFAFDGSGSSYLTAPDNPSLQPASITLEAWVTFNSPSGVQGVISKPVGPGISDSYVLILVNGQLYGGIDSAPVVQTPFTPVVGRWYHLAFTFDDTTKFHALYINGVQVASQTYVGALHCDSHNLLLGADIDNGNTGLYLNGRLDEAAIYGRALSPAEIAGLYAAGAAGKVTVGPYINTPPQLPPGVVGLGYTQQIAVLFSQPVTFNLDQGSAPGLTLSSSGLLSGVPANAGTFSLTIQVTDTNAVSNGQTFSLNVLAPVPPAAGIVSWWRAENNALDSVNTNNGYLTNGAGFAMGKVGQSFSLNGASQYVVIPNAPSLCPASVTVEAWVKVFATNGIELLFAKPLGSGTFDSYGLAIQDGVPLAAICDTNGFGTFLSSDYALVPGQWYHLAYTFDSATRHQALYVNGSAVQAGDAGTTMQFDTQPLQLGADIENGSPAYFLNGQIDEASLYNRALSASEIQGIYLLGAAGRVPLTSYQRWKAVYLNDPAAPDLGDPDGDGYVNLLEYGLAMNPTVADPPGLPTMGLFDYGAAGERLRAILMRDPTHDDVTIDVQSSSNLLTWQSLALSSNGLPFQGIGYVGGDGTGAGIKTVEIRDSATVTNAAERFMRVKVSQ